ncbi:hypothetical protein ACLOJK_001522 [Asimina triloba]
MEGEASSTQGSKPKFSVYQNATFSAALTARSLQPSKSALLFIFSVFLASFIVLLFLTSRHVLKALRFSLLSPSRASFSCWGSVGELKVSVLDGPSPLFREIKLGPSLVIRDLVLKISQLLVVLVLLGTLSALFRALLLNKVKYGPTVGVSKSSTSPLKSKEQSWLTVRQQGLLGLRPKQTENFGSESMKKPPKSVTPASSPQTVLVPLHRSVSSSNCSLRVGSDKRQTSGGKTVAPYSSPLSPGSPASLFLVSPPAPLQAPEWQTSTPWSKQQPTSAKEIQTEAMLEQFLADVDEKITESAMKAASPSQIHITPQPTLHGLSSASPGTLVKSAPASGTARSTPLRPVRMSPGSQKYTTPPKKGEGDLPPPMSMEQTIETFENLGIYPTIEQWRDRLRQWFSSVLLNPLVEKIETSHIQVMQTAAKLGISININQVGSESLNVGAPASMPSIDGTKEWQPIFTLDEDGLLHQLRAALLQARDGSFSQLPISVLQHVQQNPAVPIIQECVDAITEHQRLHALMKGDWVKGLLPQSSVRADYSVQRVREFAEGTCVKNYEYLGNGEVYDKANKKWTLELPTDSHLLLYLFCAFLEHPKWMLHVDPTSYAGAQSSKNPLFLGILPPKERFPEKYVAIISSVPSVLHPGACVLVVGKQSPPIFCLYWDKKLQFALQASTIL